MKHAAYTSISPGIRKAAEMKELVKHAVYTFISSSIRKAAEMKELL